MNHTSSEYPPLPFNFEKGSDIPKICMEMASTLKQQPQFNGHHFSNGNYKVICLESNTDKRICEIFNTNAIKNLGYKQAWQISGFGNGNALLTDSNNHLIPHGLYLNIDFNDSQCSPENLLETYEKIYETMITGWKVLNAQNCSNQNVHESSSERIHFTKKKSLLDEDTLILYILNRLSMGQVASCRAASICNCDEIVLSIEKSSIQNVVEKVGLKLPEIHNI